MARKRSRPKSLQTIWEVSDDLWTRIEPILQADWQPSPKGGQPPKDWRSILNGIIHRLRSGCQWNRLPEDFGDDSTIHRWFQRWCRNGVMGRIWAAPAAECEELGAVHWQWQSADGRLGKARFGGKKVGKNPTDRGKPGTKTSVLVDGQGGPPGAVIDGANVPDCKLLAATIEAVVIDRPKPTPEDPQHLCLDKGYDNPTGRRAAAAGGHTPHIRYAASTPRRAGRT
jgi:putative transposase